MRLSTYTLSALILSMTVLQGCSTSNSASIYTTSQAQREQIVRMGTVQSVREITIDKSDTGIGTAIGAGIGGVAAGSNIGNGRGAIVSGILGAVAGGIAGHVIEDKINKQKGWEIMVKLDSGELRALTQAADENFTPGDRVRLLSIDGITRVTH